MAEWTKERHEEAKKQSENCDGLPCGYDLQDALAEIERLTGELASASRDIEPLKVEYLKALAEIERLQTRPRIAAVNLQQIINSDAWRLGIAFYDGSSQKREGYQVIILNNRLHPNMVAKNISVAMEDIQDKIGLVR